MPKSRPQAYRKPSSAGVITISPATIPRVRKVIYWLIKDRPQLVVDACRASAEESNVRNPYHLLLDSNDYLSTREHGTQSTLDPAKIAIAAPKGSTIQRPKPTADDSDDVADYMRKCLLYPDNTLMPEEKKKFLYRKATDVKRTNLDFLSAGYRNVSKNIPDFFLGLDRIVLNLEYESVLEYVALPKPIHSPSDPSTDPTKSGVDVYPHLFNEWLREQKGVKKIFEVFVDDSLDTPHTDKSILESLSNFDVEIWKWMKLDICPSIIAKAAPNVRKVYLACNTKKSVLQGWTCKDGLLSLKRLEFLHITLYRPKYEPEDYWRTCLADFENKLLRRFQQQIDDKRRAKLPNIQMRIEDYTVLSPDLVTKSETARAVDNACGQL
ncbi:hypothetical protein BJ508DRAFT_74945 [Ascobolus immersus RN42]|uniref:Uncharacterized protein n=1 Tax=Ascobolus immersus RN42 TaxID=1160509 RepID=A0A3N4IAV5_ASCIM|nr:hypothetical protein BJ508DRAFT_74945 [Ascobolus immersus RN42]